jgi:predicted ATPase/DNA-binding winged helix-turn-helix (wHTH) protein
VLGHAMISDHAEAKRDRGNYCSPPTLIRIIFGHILTAIGALCGSSMIATVNAAMGRERMARLPLVERGAAPASNADNILIDADRKGDGAAMGSVASPMPVIAFGPFRLLVRERRLERDGKEVLLGSRALAILVMLAQRAGTVISHEELRATVWPDTAVEDSGLRVQVAAVRRALGEYGGRYVTNVPGQGYCFVAATSQGPVVAAKTDASERASGVRNVPAPLARIVGRECEIEELSRLVQEQRIVSVVAPGGMGKSTVAAAVAHRLRSYFGDDVRYVDFALLDDEAHVLPAVASAVGFSPTEPMNRLAAFLEERQLLLLFDGCEHVIGSVAALVRELTASTGGAHVLLTSREPLRIEGERIRRLVALACPPDTPCTGHREALSFSAFQLFVERATTAGAPLTSSDEEAQVIARMCRQLDGIPLAIEIVAGKVEAYGVLGTAALLETRYTLLWRGRRTAVTRHQTLSTMLDWSYNLLAEMERKVLPRLSVLTGALPIDLVHAVARAEDDDPDAVLDALASLVEKSLVAVDSSGDAALYHLLDTTRAYAQRKLDPAEERGAWQRLARHLLRTVSGESDVSSAIPTPGRLACLRASLTWALSSEGDRALAVALAELTGPLLISASLLPDAVRWSESALSWLVEGDVDTKREMRLQATLGLSAFSLNGNSPKAHAAITRALVLAKRFEDGWLQMSLLAALSIFESRAAKPREALLIADEAEAVARRMSDPESMMLAEWIKAPPEHLLGYPERAEHHCRSALSLTRPSPRLAAAQPGFDHRLAAVVTQARALWLLGRADDARSVARRAISQAFEIGQPVNVAMALGYTSTVFLWCGDFEGAGEIVERVMEYTRRHGPDFFHRLVGPGLRAELVVRRGGADVTALNDAMAALAAEGHVLWQTAFATAIAEALSSLGRVGDALSIIDGAIALTTPNGGSYDLPEMLRVKGRLLATKAAPDLDADPAEAWLLRAIECAEQQGALAWELRAAMTLADMRLARGHDAGARELVASRYRRFTQGLDTEDLRAAQRFLSGP